MLSTRFGLKDCPYEVLGELSDAGVTGVRHNNTADVWTATYLPSRESKGVILTATAAEDLIFNALWHGHDAHAPGTSPADWNIAARQAARTFPAAPWEPATMIIDDDIVMGFGVRLGPAVAVVAELRDGVAVAVVARFEAQPKSPWTLARTETTSL